MKRVNESMIEEDTFVAGAKFISDIKLLDLV